ncbi:Beta-lactamase domain-containing protein 2 [Hondaea fermentalgiana]|uniref:Beta-lactamase domain-containing protein 2 n=1 Tax=Hondaea fermentalgiana TaxID=2315210 RepID=A0A2R5GPK8_9STRA|nr:Beta-lactamase domain-containing protein 2 [Hondaea fermentalgiana]|eukprot:GBG32816.1 Beta-lactamase domain-containing protein 2 [Hondaea fermentalgiana]
MSEVIEWVAGNKLVAGTALLCAAVMGGVAFKKQQRERKMEIDTNKLQPGLEAVKKAFEANYREGREVGSQLACYVNGELVVDLNGGCDKEHKLEADSFTVIFSCTKVIESLAMAMLADRGKLDYDAPITKYWPSLDNKATVADLMRHQAGLSTLNPAPTKAEGLKIFSDHDKAREFLEANKPEYVTEQPPKRQIYHAVTRGMYANELVRRVDGRSIDEFVAEEIVNKDDKIDFSIGCPSEWQSRVSTHYPTQSRRFVVLRYLLYSYLPRSLLSLFFGPMDALQPFDREVIKGMTTKGSPASRVLALFSDVPASLYEICNNPEVRALPLSSAAGVSNARSVGRILRNLLEGDYLSPEGLKSALGFDAERHAVLKDEFMCRKMKLSNCGWGLDRFEIFGAPGWVGWGGAGGSVLVFNPELKAVMAYCVNGLDSQQHKARGVRLLTTFHEALTSRKA